MWRRPLAIEGNRADRPTTTTVYDEFPSSSFFLPLAVLCAVPAESDSIKKEPSSWPASVAGKGLSLLVRKRNITQEHERDENRLIGIFYNTGTLNKCVD